MLAGCSSPGSAPPSAGGSPAGSPAAAPVASPAACRDLSASPAAANLPGSAYRAWVVASGLDQPDDLLYANGSLYVAVLGAGSIRRLTPGASAVTLPVRVAHVEGMVFIGTRFFVAGQADDAVYEVPAGGGLRKVIQLNPVAGQDGVDGIGAQGGLLIVPDSPRGTVDWVDPDSGRITRQVGGFTRPTGVWPEADGSVLVTDEFGNAAVRVAPNGAKTYLVRGLPIVDDVAEDSTGATFVVTPAAGGGRLAQLAGGSAQELASGLQAPQGLAVDGADNLYFSQEDAGAVDLLLRTFKIVPLQAIPAGGGPVCVQVERAAGFQAAITLKGGPGVQVVGQPGAGSRGAVLLTGCGAAPCTLTAVSGSRRDSVQVQSSG